MKMSTIEYFKKSNFGTESLYIKDIAIAKAINSLTGKKTISYSDIRNLKTLGFTFLQVLN